MQCKICKSVEFNFEFIVTREDKFAITPDRKMNPARYQECANCGVMVLDDSAGYETVYSDGSFYEAEGTPSIFLNDRFEQIINLPDEQSDNVLRVRRITDFIESYLPVHEYRNKQVLDIGAGMGVFLYKFITLDGWTGTALEPEPNAFQHLKKVLPNMKIVNGYVDGLPSNQKFNLITLNRVLEHLHDPGNLLVSIANYLEEDGVLYLELPDVQSYYNDGANNEAFGYGHYHIYSPKGLQILITNSGYELMLMNRVVEPSTKYTIYAFVRKRNVNSISC